MPVWRQFRGISDSLMAARRSGVYVGSAARRKGRAICARDVNLPIAETEAHILDAVEREPLDEDVFTGALNLAVRRLCSETPARAQMLAERER